MTDLGKISSCLGLQIICNRKEGWFHISQTGYIDKLVENFGLLDAKSVSTGKF